MAASQGSARRAIAQRILPLVAAAILAVAVVACAETQTPTGPARSNAPTVIKTEPIDGGLWTRGDPIRVTFDRDVLPESVAAGITIIGVPVTVTYDAASRTATVQPGTPLQTGGFYTLIVKQIKDSDGAVMRDVVTITFTVVSPEVN